MPIQTLPAVNFEYFCVAAKNSRKNSSNQPIRSSTGSCQVASVQNGWPPDSYKDHIDLPPVVDKKPHVPIHYSASFNDRPLPQHLSGEDARSVISFEDSPVGMVRRSVSVCSGWSGVTKIAVNGAEEEDRGHLRRFGSIVSRLSVPAAVSDENGNKAAFDRGELRIVAVTADEEEEEEENEVGFGKKLREKVRILCNKVK
jgi:hypothetical protein